MNGPAACASAQHGRPGTQPSQGPSVQGAFRLKAPHPTVAQHKWAQARASAVAEALLTEAKYVPPRIRPLRFSPASVV